MPELALAEQVIELGRRLINQKQSENPKLDRDETMPVEHRDDVWQECPKWMVLDKPEPDPVFEQARDKHDGPIECRFEQDRPNQWRAIVAASANLVATDAEERQNPVTTLGVSNVD